MTQRKEATAATKFRDSIGEFVNEIERNHRIPGEVEVHVGVGLFREFELEHSQFNRLDYQEIEHTFGEPGTGTGTPTMHPETETIKVLDIGYAKVVEQRELDDYSTIFVDPNGFDNSGFPFLRYTHSFEKLHFGEGESKEQICSLCGTPSDTYVELTDGTIYCSMKCRYEDQENE